MSRHSSVSVRAIVRAIRVIGRRAHSMPHELIAEAAVQYLRPGHVQFVAEFVMDCAYYAHKLQPAAEGSQCAECGKRCIEPRARYCSAKCRQRAYRKRVTAKRRGSVSQSSPVTDTACGGAREASQT